MSHNITVEGGSAVRLATAGKFCDRDIVITATGSANEPVIEPLTITENGTYTVSEGVDGYSPVTVNVASQSDTDEPYTTITATVKRKGVAVPGVYVEATYSTNKVSGITDENGVVVFKITKTMAGSSGNYWTVSAIQDGETLATSQSYVSFNTYSNTLNLFYATVKINCETGATVTLEKGESVWTAIATDNSASFEVERSGEYTATVNYNGIVVSKVITIGTTSGVFIYNIFATKLSLEETDWSRISAISAEGNPENYFSIGDTKSVHLSGQVGVYSSTSADELVLDETMYVYIIGFNHNAEIEGNGIHFGCFKNADGVDVALVDYKYGNMAGGNSPYSVSQFTSIISHVLGGEVIDGNDIITNPPANTLMAAFPVDLRTALKQITKYNSTRYNIESRKYYITIPNVFEIKAANMGYANSTADVTKRYAYYVNGASAKRYKHSDPASACGYFVREIINKYEVTYSAPVMAESGSAGFMHSSYAYGVTAIFMV